MIPPLRGIILYQDAPVVVDGERDFEDIVPGLVHPDGVVLVDKPLDRSVRVSALRVSACLRDGKLGLGRIRDIELEMQQALVADTAAGRRVPATHPAGDGFARLVFKDIIASVFAGRVGDGLLEPGVVLAGVVEHEIEIDVDIPGFGLADQVLQVVFRAQIAAHGIIVVHIVTVVRHGFVDGREPEGGGPDAVEIVEVLGDAADVAPAVTVTVSETVHVELIGNA